MLCNTCNQQIPDESPFCNYCGARQDAFVRCAACNQEIAAGSPFCNYCGARQDAQQPPEPTEESRQAEPPAQDSQGAPPQAALPPYQQQDIPVQKTSPVRNRRPIVILCFATFILFFTIVNVLFSINASYRSASYASTYRPSGTPAPAASDLPFSNVPDPDSEARANWVAAGSPTLGRTFEEYRTFCSQFLERDILPTDFVTQAPYQVSTDAGADVRVQYQTGANGELTVLCLRLHLDLADTTSATFFDIMRPTFMLFGAYDDSEDFSPKFDRLFSDIEDNRALISSGAVSASDATNWFSRQQLGKYYYFLTIYEKGATGTAIFIVSAIDELPAFGPQEGATPSPKRTPRSLAPSAPVPTERPPTPTATAP